MRRTVVLAVLAVAAGAAAAAGLPAAAAGEAPPESALATLGDTFPQALRADPTPPLPPAVQAVKGYADPRVALVTSAGKRGLLLSSEPVAAPDASGRLRALDLDLVRRGDSWIPASSPLDAQVELDSGTLRLDPRGAPAIAATPLGADPAFDATLVGGRGFLAGTQTDTDTLVQATASGLETFAQLRSERSPTAFSWRLELPAGTAATRVPSGYVFRYDGKPLLTVRAPWAIDAAGAEVPVGLRLDGDVLTMVVHHGAGTNYPVLADPTWESHYDFTDPAIGAQGFFELDEESGTPGYELSVDDSGFGLGLFIYPRGGGAYPNPPDGEEVRGSIFFRAPGTTRLKQATWNGVRYRLEQGTCGPPTGFRNVRQFLRFTLSLSGTASVEHQIGPDGTHGELTEIAGSQVSLTDPAAVPGGTNASMAMWTDVTGASVPTIEPNPGTSGCRTDLIDPFASADRVDLVLTDFEAPTISDISGPLLDQAGDVDGAWLSAQEIGGGAGATGTIAATDPGSGISALELAATNAATGGTQRFREHDPGALCNATHTTPGQQGRICPEDDVWNLTNASPLPLSALGVEEGRWALRVTASDLSGQSASSGPWSYYVDTTPPEADVLDVTLPPATDDRIGHWVRADDPALDLAVALRGTDPPSRSPAGQPTGTLSGVRTYGLALTPSGLPAGTLVPSPGVPAEQCGPGGSIPFGPIATPCPSTGPGRTAVLARDLPEGETLVSARVGDHAGNGSAERTGRFWVDNTRPTIAASGSLADLDDTWLAPSGPLALDVTADDAHASGVRTIRTAVQRADGGAIEPPDARDVCPEPRRGQAPVAECPEQATTTTQLAGADLPEGEVQVRVDATDAAGNATAAGRGQLDYRLHVDRTPPEVALGGEVAAIADDDAWTNPGRDLTALVAAGDVGSGVRMLELWVRDEQGERRLASEEVCHPAEPAVGADPPCPLEASHTFTVAASDVSDGRVTFEARAIEFTGRRARIRETTYLDTEAPRSPRSLVIRRVEESTASVSWERPADPPDLSGVAAYEYAVVYAGHTDLVWNRTPYTGVELSGLPEGVDVEVLVRTIDGVGLASDPASGMGPGGHGGTDEVRLLAPAEGAQLTGRVTYSWFSVRGAETYDLYVDEQLVAEGLRLPRVTLELEDTPSGTHTWRVVANIGAAGTRARASTRASRTKSSRTRTYNYVQASGPTRLKLRGVQLARAVRPILRFHHDERWRPLDIRKFLDEPGIEICRKYAARELCGSSRDGLYQHVRFRNLALSTDTDDAYIDIPLHGLYLRPFPHGERQSPYDECVGHGRLDCDSGPRSKIYWHQFETSETVYIDYWWYLRHNPFAAIGTHPGDWEGMTIGVSKRTSRIWTVGFASHEGTWRYAPGVTQFSGDRTHVFIASNSHAAYPRACPGERVRRAGTRPELLLCRQDDGSAQGRDGPHEQGFDGKANWGRNPDAACYAGEDCIDEIPSRKVYIDRVGRSEARGIEGTWSAWKGHWGQRVDGAFGISSPESPGQQGRFQRPQIMRYSERRSFEPRAAATAPVGAGGLDHDEVSCEDYGGPLVTAVACDPVRLADAAERGELGLEPTFRISTSVEDADGGGVPGVAQLAGDLPAVGDTVTVAGTASVQTTLMVRVATPSEPVEIAVGDLGLERGGRQDLRVIEGASGRPALRIAGRRVTAKTIRGGRFATARAFRRGSRVYVRLRSTRSLRLQVFGVDAAGRRVRGSTRVVRTRPGRLVRVRLGDRDRRIRTVRLLRPVVGAPADLLNVRVR